LDARKRLSFAPRVAANDIYDLFYWANKIRIDVSARLWKFCGDRRGQSRWIARKIASFCASVGPLPRSAPRGSAGD